MIAIIFCIFSLKQPLGPLRKLVAMSICVCVCAPPPTMGCHPMLTENPNFVTNALRGDLSTVNVRP